MFRAPFEAYRTDQSPTFVEQLLSESALQRTGYFDPQRVRHWRHAMRTLSSGSGRRMAMEIGLSEPLVRPILSLAAVRHRHDARRDGPPAKPADEPGSLAYRAI
jgi:hypothetical protein